MNLKRVLLKMAYPAYRAVAAYFGNKGTILVNKGYIAPVTSFYNLSIVLNNGSVFAFEGLRGKKVLLVNTASDCIYTAQYAALQQVHQLHGEQLAVIAFPSNDFGEQEKGSNNDIAQFCAVNYGVQFIVAGKSHVLGASANDVFQWLSDPKKNGWNGQLPEWNFSKYLVDETGVLTHYFRPAISPAYVAKTAFGG